MFFLDYEKEQKFILFGKLHITPWRHPLPFQGPREWKLDFDADAGACSDFPARKKERVNAWGS